MDTTKMSNEVRSKMMRRLGLAAALLIVASSAGMAFGVFPGAWKVKDNGKAVRKRPGSMPVAIIKNQGPEDIVVSSKGSNVTITGEIVAGAKLSVILPPGAKNVKLVDANFNTGKGAKGSLIWAKQLPNLGPFIGGGGSGGAD